MDLLPGFRFHPTDVELVMYWLKRKVMGKKLHSQAIAEVNIYKFAPWDLPDKSSMKTKDREWFFFCPIEKRYAHGTRIRRSTENGYWKSTGKDKHVRYDDRNVGMMRTMVFHSGRASKGERTDWVIHEYRIVDEQLSASGVQDLYVLCKVFKKSGLGPKIGGQYGAPFDDADWDDEDLQDHQTSSSISLFPEMDNSLVTGTVDLGTSSVLPFLEAGPSSAVGPSSNEKLINVSDDEIVSLLESFTDEPTLQYNEDGNHKDDSIGSGKEISLNSDENAIFDDLDGLDLWTLTNGIESGSGLQIDDPPLNLLPQDNSTYIELDDLEFPLNFSSGLGEPEYLIPPHTYESHRGRNMPESSFDCMAYFDSCISHPPVSLDASNMAYGGADKLHVVADQFYEGSNVT